MSDKKTISIDDVYRSLRVHDKEILKHFNDEKLSDHMYLFYSINSDIISNALSLIIAIQTNNINSIGVDNNCRAIIEAMSAACPCIVSNAGGNPELIDSNFIFKKKNVSELAELILNMSREKMKIEAKKNFRCVSNYSIDRLDKIRDEFYSNLLIDGD